MNQSAHDQKVRKTVEIDTELEKFIQAKAELKKWSFSYTAYTLLQSAMRENQRKNKKALS